MLQGWQRRDCPVLTGPPQDWQTFDRRRAMAAHLREQYFPDPHFVTSEPQAPQVKVPMRIPPIVPDASVQQADQ
jgi:hypothetical protein